jgi:Uma2 family endonuclease
MALTLDDRAIHPLTVDEVMRMVDAGVLGEDAYRLELLDGLLTEKPVKGPEHEAVKERFLDWLAPGVAERRFAVRIEAALVVPDRINLPEPDIAVLDRGGPPDRHPASALLVVEVAITSLATDLGRKPQLYASAGVPEYWVADVANHRLEVFTEPGPQGYARRRSLAPPATARPAHLPLEPLELEALFAGV